MGKRTLGAARARSAGGAWLAPSLLSAFLCSVFHLQLSLGAGTPLPQHCWVVLTVMRLYREGCSIASGVSGLGFWGFCFCFEKQSSYVVQSELGILLLQSPELWWRHTPAESYRNSLGAVGKLTAPEL